MEAQFHEEVKDCHKDGLPIQRFRSRELGFLVKVLAYHEKAGKFGAYSVWGGPIQRRAHPPELLPPLAEAHRAAGEQHPRRHRGQRPRADPERTATCR